MTGYVSGKLTAVRRLRESRREVFLWVCRCECGKTKLVSVADLHQKKVKSCGCLKAERRNDPKLVKRREAILALHTQGVAIMAIARQFDISRQRVYQILEQYKETEE